MGIILNKKWFIGKMREWEDVKMRVEKLDDKISGNLNTDSVKIT